MTLLGQIAAFVLGVYLSIRMIVALYQIVDLWHRIGTDYPRVIRGVLGCAATIAAIAWLLNPPVRVAFALGFGAFLLFYVSVFGLWRVFLLALRQPVDDASAGPNAEKQAR